MEVNGNNVTVKNSRLSNGKNVLRCFSTNNFRLENSLLSNSRNFLMEAGSNEYMSYDETTKYSFVSSTGENKNATIVEYLNSYGQDGDNDVTNYLMGSFDNKETMKNSLISIQNSLNNRANIEDIYKGSIVFKDIEAIPLL